jgi:D-glycero-D-manno-heptose 1,7-bisphosphate phosphatase
MNEADDPGLWCEIGAADRTGRAALFLDRDGVIVVDTHYLGRPEELRLIPGAAAAIARANALGIPVVVVTNQSGIGRGYYDWAAFEAVHAALAAGLAAEGAHLDAVLACAYHHDARGAMRVADHSWRKPRPGMILEALRRLRLDPSSSWIIGDRTHDLAAALAAHLAGGTLVGASSPPERQAALQLAGARFTVETEADLHEAVAALIARGRLPKTGNELPRNLRKT